MISWSLKTRSVESSWVDEVLGEREEKKRR